MGVVVIQHPCILICCPQVFGFKSKSAGLKWQQLPRKEHYCYIKEALPGWNVNKPNQNKCYNFKIFNWIISTYSFKQSESFTTLSWKHVLSKNKTYWNTAFEIFLMFWYVCYVDNTFHPGSASLKNYSIMKKETKSNFLMQNEKNTLLDTIFGIKLCANWWKQIKFGYLLKTGLV